MADFVELTDADFQATLAGVPVAIVDYYASWCGACRMAAPMFRRVAEEAGVPIYKIDAEKNPGSRAGVNIANLPTLAVFRAGAPVADLCTTKEEGLREFLRENGVLK